MKSKPWVEKYRPKTFDEFYGQDSIVSSIKSILARGNNPHFLFMGPAGTGKTSMAETIARARFGDEWPGRFHLFNSSKERGINDIRGEIFRLSKFRGERIICLDEGDNMTPAAQQAARGVIEQRNTPATFILTGNYSDKILGPVLSRFAIFHFAKLTDKVVLGRLIKICRAENITIDPAAQTGLKRMARYVNGDLRKAINMLERIINENNAITKETVAFLEQSVPIIDILKTAVKGNFKDAKSQIQKHYILSAFSANTITGEILDALDAINGSGDLTDQQTIKLYAHLGDLQYHLRIGCDPHIELIDFISKCWVIKHLPQTCPAI